MLILKYCQSYISALAVHVGSSVTRRMGRSLPRGVRGLSASEQLGKVTHSFALMLFVFMCSFFSGVGAMPALKDDEMSAITGQALMQMGKEPGSGISNDITFYKAGLDAEIELNLNIEKLQLGCGGVNGPGCDIDIDRLSLSGGTWGADGRPSSAAILTRPFFEFAIKNDQSKTLREVVGIRMSTENAQGMMTLGDQQPGASDPGNLSGINSLSGYMKLGPTSGTAVTEARPMTYDNYTCQAGDGCTGSYAGLFTAMTGRIYLDLLGIGVKNFSSTSYGLLLEPASAFVTVPSTVVSGKRMQSANLMGSATIGTINFAGEMAANVDNVILGTDLELSKNVTGSMSGLTATVPITQSLKFIHKINVNSPFSLSMQKADVLWPGASEAAQQGWWMAFEDEIDIGSISPEDPVPITNAVLLQALGPTNPSWSPNPVPAGSPITCTGGYSINCALTTALSTRTYEDNNVTYNEVYGVECDGFQCLGGDLPVGNLTVPANVNFPLQDLKLGGQSITPNCYGTARFC